MRNFISILLINFLIIHVTSQTLSGQLQNCRITCTSENGEFPPITTSGGAVRGKQGPRGDPGQQGPPGQDCQCPDTESLIQEVTNLEMIVNRIRKRVKILEQPPSCDVIKSTDILSESGVYTIYPYGPLLRGLPVYCDMKSSEGGWMVIQKRFNGSENFNRNWDDYVNGFGNVNGEYWLGLKHIHRISTQWDVELRIDLEDFDGNKKYAVYKTFSVGPGYDYKLTFGDYIGTAGDSLEGSAHGKHQGMRFSALNRDQDRTGSSCAVVYQGGWWFDKCLYSNLNGPYYERGHQPSGWKGIIWYDFNGSESWPLKYSEMKLRIKN